MTIFFAGGEIPTTQVVDIRTADKAESQFCSLRWS